MNLKKIISELILNFESSAKPKCPDPDPIPIKNHTDCAEIYNNLRSCSVKFIEGAMNYSDPFTVCSNFNTSQAYNRTMRFYDQLFSSHDHITKILCSDAYLNKNRMGLIVRTIQEIKSVWEQSNCNNCYLDSSLRTHDFSEDTTKFFTLQSNYSSCVENAAKTTKNNFTAICQACVSSYQELNHAYDIIKDQFGYYKICFDIQDKVSNIVIYRFKSN
jgi:Osteopetrosis-associated transmembrane protein 1 precursor